MDSVGPRLLTFAEAEARTAAREAAEQAELAKPPVLRSWEVDPLTERLLSSINMQGEGWRTYLHDRIKADVAGLRRHRHEVFRCNLGDRGCRLCGHAGPAGTSYPCPDARHYSDDLLAIASMLGVSNA